MLTLPHPVWLSFLQLLFLYVDVKYVALTLTSNKSTVVPDFTYHVSTSLKVTLVKALQLEKALHIIVSKLAEIVTVVNLSQDEKHEYPSILTLSGITISIKESQL